MGCTDQGQIVTEINGRLAEQLRERDATIAELREKLASVLEGQDRLKRQTVRIREAALGGEQSSSDTEDVVRSLREKPAAAERLNAAWVEKAQAWLASPEAAARLEGYRELGAKCAALEGERDEARAKSDEWRARYNEERERFNLTVAERDEARAEVLDAQDGELKALAERDRLAAENARLVSALHVLWTYCMQHLGDWYMRADRRAIAEQVDAALKGDKP